MLFLILKLDEVDTFIETTGEDIKGLLETLRESIILDVDGETWAIDSNAKLYFDVDPPHFEIDCKIKK